MYRMGCPTFEGYMAKVSIVANGTEQGTRSQNTIRGPIAPCDERSIGLLDGRGLSALLVLSHSGEWAPLLP